MEWGAQETAEHRAAGSTEQTNEQGLPPVHLKPAGCVRRFDRPGTNQEANEGTPIPRAALELETGDLSQEDLMPAGGGVQGPRAWSLAGKLEGVADEVGLEENEIRGVVR